MRGLGWAGLPQSLTAWPNFVNVCKTSSERDDGFPCLLLDASNWILCIIAANHEAHVFCVFVDRNNHRILFITSTPSKVISTKMDLYEVNEKK